jgi:repressor LexA
MGGPQRSLMSERLTKRQQDILGFIEAEAARRGMPPTIREIAAHFNIASPNGVWCHLKVLEEKGYLRKEPGRSRGTAPLSNDMGTGKSTYYPLVGEVAAGGPKLAIQTDEGSLTLDEAAGARPGDFLLKVKGDSMIGAGINPGDLAVVRPAHEAQNGEITVVMVGDEEATLKRYFTDKNGWIRLVPENPDYRPIVIKPGGPAVRIIGKVVGVLRKY